MLTDARAGAAIPSQPAPQDELEHAETVRSLRQRLEELPRNPEFGNGRLVGNIFETAITRQASRIIATESSDLTQLIPADLG